MSMLAFGLGWTEMLVIGIAAILIFGRRLPEVGRDLGKGLVEFKRGLKGVEDDLDEQRQAARDVRRAVRDAGGQARDAGGQARDDRGRNDRARDERGRDDRSREDRVDRDEADRPRDDRPA